MASVELRDVGKRYGDTDVVGKVNLRLDDGSLTVFVGPSGCGKSTLLRMIAGLEGISKGDILIGGARVNEATPTERGIAMVFQNYALYPHMTVRQNIGFPLRMAGMTKSEVSSRVDRAAERLRIGPLLERKPAALSGGQRQRVAIGRAIVRDPTVFLFDEPLSNLDAELRVQMRLEIASLHKALASTMIYVTHDQVEAMTLADTIVVLRGGHVEQVGSPLALYDDPDNLFVAGFIGSPRMNFLRARAVARLTAGIGLTLADFSGATLVVPAGREIEVGAEVLVGVRPEHFRPDGATPLDVPIEVVESLGGTAFAYSGIGRSHALTIDVKDDRSVKAGTVLRTGLDPARALLFDPATGHRLR